MLSNKKEKVKLYLHLSGCLCLIMIDFYLLENGFLLLAVILVYLMMFVRPLFLN